MTKSAKKLIEVALPLDAINEASAKEKQPFTRKHPRTFHVWWARRPNGAARALLFSQLVDDPSARPDLFPTQEAQDKERERLFEIAEQLARWENTNNHDLLQRASEEIWASWRRACAENADHPRAEELFDPNRLPEFHDPFAGGGALPLEAQRLGLVSYASDLNPVSVLINRAMIAIPPVFSGRAPVNPQSRGEEPLIARPWSGTEGLAEDVRHYGEWIRAEAERRMGALYPPVEITAELAERRPDLSGYVGRRLRVIAWIWARTVKSPNPAFGNVDVPLVSTFLLSSKKGKEAYVQPVIEEGGYRFDVLVGKPKDMKATRAGTKTGGSGSSFFCLMSGTAMPFEYLRQEAKAGHMGVRLMAMVLEGDRERLYIPPSPNHSQVALDVTVPDQLADTPLPDRALGFRVQEYGMRRWRDLFTSRQLTALSTFSDLCAEVREKVRQDAVLAGMTDTDPGLEEGGGGAQAYGEAVAVYLSLATSRWSDMSNMICSWNTTNQNVRALFARQAIPMNWDYAELSPFSGVGSWFSVVESGCAAFESLPAEPAGYGVIADAASQTLSRNRVVSTDPPYYDNIGYADLSDFFYVWLRRAIRDIYPSLFSTMAVPKREELVATPYRHGSRQAAEEFFLTGMTKAMATLVDTAHPAAPITIYYAFKQSEVKKDGGFRSSGWEAFLEAVIRSGLCVTGTWPVRTERAARSVGLGTNALASSIVLVCRPRSGDSLPVFRREFRAELAKELPEALAHLQRGNIAPVDLAQAAIGPGMAVFSRYSEVRDVEGKRLSVGDALDLINEVLDECLTEQEGDFEADTRWALAWYEQQGFSDGSFGTAETLSKAKVTSVDGLEEAGIVVSKAGRVRLLTPAQLPDEWDPSTDPRLTIWEIVHHLIRRLETGGEQAAGGLARQVGSKAETARELAYRLYSIAERKKRSEDAQRYNSLVQSWPEISRLARESAAPARSRQADIFEGEA